MPHRLFAGALAFLALSLAALTPLHARPQAATPAGAKLPLCGLAEALAVPDICLVRYRVSTTSPACQAFFDQALGYYYSYVWMEAARSFETATQKDPDCALAWWGLSRALERWGRGDANKAMLKANELKDRASHREQQLILTRMQE